MRKYLITFLLFGSVAIAAPIRTLYTGLQLYTGMQLTSVPVSAVPAIAVLTGTGDGDYNFSADTSTGFFAVQDAAGVITTYGVGDTAFVSVDNAFCKVWSCIGAGDSTISGDLTTLELNNGYYGDMNLVALNVSSCKALQVLDCQNNWYLPTLDVSGLTALSKIDLLADSALTNLNVSGCTALNYLDCNSAALRQSSVDAALAECDASGINNGRIDASQGLNQAPSSAGLISKAALIAKYWSVTTQ
jgi:Leucine-rich repeat (LRR) protein